jgi:hypothetical protein
MQPLQEKGSHVKQMLEEESGIDFDKVKAARKKQVEKKAEKTSTAAAAFEDEDKIWS